MNFYRRFIVQYLNITVLITDYLKILKKKKQKKKNQFTLNNKAKKAFKKLKQIFKKTSLLIYFNSKIEVCIKTNASVVIIVEILI